jgi:hypothetical protein
MIRLLLTALTCTAIYWIVSFVINGQGPAIGRACAVFVGSLLGVMAVRASQDWKSDTLN